MYADGWLNNPFDLSGKTIWVAGHDGMVGRAVCRALAGSHHRILTEARRVLDLRDQAAVQSWMRDNRPDIIVLAAATVGGIGANAARPAEFLYDNLMIEANVIHAAHVCGVEKLLFLGSSCIYPVTAEQPVRETALLSGVPEPTNEAYAIAKIAGIKLCQSYRRQYGCDFIAAMPCNLYGPGDRYDENASHVIPSLMMKAHRAKIRNDKVMSVWGSGRPLREFLYVDDLAGALVFLLGHYSGAEIVNIGSGREITIAGLAQKIADVTGFCGDLAFDSSRPDGSPRKIMDSSAIFRRGWRPGTALDDGLALAYEDYRQRVLRQAG